MWSESSINDVLRGLTWLSYTFHKNSLLWPLPLTLPMMLQSSDGWPRRNVQFHCPALQKWSPGKILLSILSAEVSGPPWQIFGFSGVRNWGGWKGVQIPAQEFFYFCGRDVKAVTLAAFLRKKNRDVSWDFVRCDPPKTKKLCYRNLNVILITKINGTVLGNVE